ncbi:MAG: hypothetical protein [Bacteriophage sp.]|nr:MAG: hypothetical protein [Bacteriophage sp.]
MSQTLHQLYRKKAIVLARTMVVKFHSIATAINTDLINRGYTVDETDMSTWKYYMNMAGLYHQSDYDRLLALSNNQSQYIVIKVAGDTTAIDANFTKELMYGESGDTALANEYRFNTDYYNALVEKYPEFEPLIQGILNPIDFSVSLSANDGEILYFGGYLKTLLPSGYYGYILQDYGPISDSYRLEVNEENVIPILQEYINVFVSRWLNSNYVLTSNLFYPTFLGMLYLSIPQIIGNIRLGNAKTAFTHSFHIREYLESFGNLGWICDHLSKSVLIWIYRNLMWLDANRGKQKTFNAIVENVLTASNIPLDHYRLRHNVSKMTRSNLLPSPFMVKEAVNYNAPESTADYKDILNIIEKEVGFASENYYDQAGQAVKTTNVSRYSMFDNVSTKVLESTVIDLSNQIAVTKEDIAMNLWLYTASTGQYTGTVIFTDPYTNNRIQLTPLNAYILALYCFNKAWAGYDMDIIPTMYARMVPRGKVALDANHPKFPSLADIKQGVLSKYISDADIQSVLGTYAVNFKYASSNAFSFEATRAFTEANRKYMNYCAFSDANARGYGEWIAHQCYWFDVACPLTKTEMHYSDWMTLHGIDISGYSRTALIDLAYSIVSAAAGVDLNASEELTMKQTAALSVLKHFASYTIQIIQNTAYSTSLWLDWKVLRITNDRETLKSSSHSQLPMYKANAHWRLNEGNVWLIEWLSTTTPTVKEQLSEVNHVDVSYNVLASTAAKRERARLAGYGVVSASIPPVVTNNYTKNYTTLTSSLYPFYPTDALDGVFATESVVYVIPPVTDFTHIVDGNVNVGAVIRLTPATITARETLSIAANTGNITISPHTLNSYETINIAAKVESKITIKPRITVTDETLDSYMLVSNIIKITSA